MARHKMVTRWLITLSALAALLIGPLGCRFVTVPPTQGQDDRSSDEDSTSSDDDSSTTTDSGSGSSGDDGYGDGAGDDNGAGGDDSGDPGAGGAGGVDHGIDDPGDDAVPAQVVENPGYPNVNGGSNAWPDADDLAPIDVVAGRDSVVLLLPYVGGARDYRAFALPTGTAVSVDGDGREDVIGTDIFCAGYRQHNTAAIPEPDLLQEIEITGLTGLNGSVDLVVEAIDRPCPFPGVFGRESSTTSMHNPEVPVDDRIDIVTYTEDEIRARYGSMIHNGQGPADVLSTPAVPNPPIVLARATVRVTPDTTTPTPVQTFFDEFTDMSDQPIEIAAAPTGSRTPRANLFQNSAWNFYSYGADYTDFFMHNGQLHTLLADWGQDVFGTNIAIPRQAAALDDEAYVKVHFEVGTSPTSRRYWWFVMCGAEQFGQTFADDGTLTQPLVQTPFFYQPDGRNPSLAAWNCLQIFPRDGWPAPLAGANPQSDIRVMVNTAGAPDREGVINVSPDQYNNGQARPSWFRRMDANGNLAGPILDDVLRHAPRIKYDLYIRRNRVILYAQGEQVLCNDLGPASLTMAEGAVGFGHVLYHSTAERVEAGRSYWLRTGQHHYRHNTPYIDVRRWDNMGYEEGTSAPAGFDANRCYVHGQ